LWRGKNYAPLLQQPFSADAISAPPKGNKLLQRSADSMRKLAAAVERCLPDSGSSPAPDIAVQRTFLQDLQQHIPAQLAAELLSCLQAWPDLPDALLSAHAGQPFAISRVQVAAHLLWRGATKMLISLLGVAHLRAEEDSCMQIPSLELLEQLLGTCCISGAPRSSAQVDWSCEQPNRRSKHVKWECRFMHAPDVRIRCMSTVCFTQLQLCCD
jgi:hypothetical protein